MATLNMQAKLAAAFDALKGDYKYTNVMQAPRIEKVIVSTGTGKVDDKNKIALIQDRLAVITGQKASPRAAKKSIAQFKLREGDIVGYQVTLRGARMNTFLDKLIDIAFPQTQNITSDIENKELKVLSWNIYMLPSIIKRSKHVMS